MTKISFENKAKHITISTSAAHLVDVEMVSFAATILHITMKFANMTVLLPRLASELRPACFSRMALVYSGHIKLKLFFLVR